MSLFDSIAKTLSGRRGAPASSAELAKALDAAVAERDRAALAYSAHEATRPEAVLAGEAGRQEFRERLTALAGDADDASALVSALRQRLDQALHEEEQARRITVYNAARAARDAAAKKLAAEYPNLVGGLRDLLRAVAEADDAVELANEALPDAAFPLAPVESLVRDLPGESDEIVSEKVVRLWSPAGSNFPAPDEIQGQVNDLGDGKGVLWRADPAGKLRQAAHFDLKTFRRVERRKGRPGAAGPRLAAMALPELKAGQVPLWIPDAFLPSARTVLRQLDDLANEAAQPVAEREIITTFEPSEA